ncbi:MAG: PAS domain S-box protein [Anaerolineae bacterium]|nr:PAS domain S-box protein [Anaerolineae bacterium]
MKSPILSRFNQWFSLPRFETENEARAAYLLAVTVRLILIAQIVYALLTLVGGKNLLFLGSTASAVSSIVVLALIRRRRVTAAYISFSFVMWAWLSLAALRYGGLSGSIITALSTTTLVLSILLPSVWRLRLILLSLISFLALYLLDIYHMLPPFSRENLETELFIEVTIFLMAAGLVHLIANNLSDALERARSNEQALTAVLSDLASTTISKSYLDDILRSINDALIVLGKDMHIERMNRAALEVLGYAETDLLGKSPDLIFSEDALVWLEQARTNPTKWAETTFISHTGKAIPVSFSASPLIDEHGQPQGIVCVAQDLSERQQAAAELVKREELYRTLGRSLPDMGVVLFDQDLRILIAEGTALRSSGYPGHEAEGRLLSNIVTPASYEKLEPLYRAALSGQHIVQDYHPTTGQQIYNVQTVPVKNGAGVIFAGMVLIQDVTTRRQNENELKQHLDQLMILRRVDDEVSRKLNVPYVLNLALDMAVRVSLARAGAILLLDDQGILMVAQMIGQFSGTLVDGYPRSPDGVAQQVLESGRAQTTDQFTAIPLISNQHPMGVLLLETVRPLSDENLDFMQVLAGRAAAAVDNARLYEISRSQLSELSGLYDRVSQLEQLKTDMIRIAAHDLRNPIGVILGFSELLLDMNKDQAQAEQVQHIHMAAKHMQRIVQDILSLERIEQMQQGYHETANLVELALTAYDVHYAQARDKKLVYRHKLPILAIDVQCDPPQLQEAVANLISNAIKYTPEGGQVEICIQMEDHRVRVEVSDTGYGIPEEFQARLFQPFSRARSPETREIEGTGLGLHLVKNIIERHNGELYVRSVYGQGSTFGFCLPTAGSTPDAVAPENGHEPAGKTQP